MLLISLGLGIAQVFVCIKTFNKANGDYLEFVKYIKGVLIFEGYAMTIQSFIEMYYEEGFWMALITAVITGLISYFLWNKEMNTYFRKRVEENTDD